MKKDELVDAIGEVDVRFVEASKELRPRRGRRWLSLAAAAILVLAVGIGGYALRHRETETSPDAALHLSSGVERLATAVYPKRAQYGEGGTREWWEERQGLALTGEESGAFRSYLTAAVPAFLGGREGENAVCSPMDIYIALAALTETTGGETQRQLLDLLGQDSVEEARALTKRAWNALYMDDGRSKLELAASLWLADGMEYDGGVLKTLAGDYYATSFSGQPGSGAYDSALQSWIDNHTGGLLAGEAGDVALDPETVMALVTTVYFKDKWNFDQELTDTGVFHAPSGDVEADYMHQTMEQAVCYRGDGFDAVVKNMENSKMLLILPGEGVSPEELLSNPEALALLCGQTEEGGERYEVELALPRFDVKSDGKLNDALKSLGVTDAFTLDADFTPLDVRTESGVAEQVFLSRVLHAARVKVDETGCEGAAYTSAIVNVSTAAPQVSRIALTFDRPFLFAVIKDGLPVFTGIVNEP